MLENHEHKHPVHEFDGIIENRENSPPPYFTILFYGLIIWGVVFVAYYLLSGWSSHGEFEQNMQQYQQQYSAQQQAPASASSGDAAETPAAAEAIDAAALYAEHCAMCQAADGSGGIGPDLTGDYAYGKTSADIYQSIDSGRPGGMPGFGNQLAKAEIDALTTYLQEL